MKHTEFFGITKNTPKESLIKNQQECKKCMHCCNYDSGILLDKDIERLAKHFHMEKEDFIKKYGDEIEKFNTKKHKLKRIKQGKPYGKCVLLNDQEGCAVHGIKPLHCKIGTCGKEGEAHSIWFSLNYFVNPDDPESIRQWAVHLKTHPTIPGGELHELVADKERLKKILSFEVLRSKASGTSQKQAFGGGQNDNRN